MLTASHNPPADNGYKVYFGGKDQGSQIVSPSDRDIESHVREVASTLTWAEIPRSQDRVGMIPESIVDDYIEATRLSLLLPAASVSPLKVVYTAMHGVGGKTFLMGIRALGLPSPVLVDRQFEPDGDFPTVSLPNPEEEGVLDLSFNTAREVGAHLIVAHDPDADRLAVALPEVHSAVGYQTLTGNQLGAILGWWMAERAMQTGQSGTLANSLVSSPVLAKIAEHFGLNHEETLTGFKYVSRVVNLIFGFEEALGYLVTPNVVRDKDGISAGLLIISLADSLAAEDKTLWDYLDHIEKTVGYFASGQVTLLLKAGAKASAVTNALRKSSLTTIGARTVNHFDDFLEGISSFPHEDILRYYLDDGSRVIVRPSGTEPKVKIYIDTVGNSSRQATTRLDQLEGDLRSLVANLS